MPTWRNPKFYAACGALCGLTGCLFAAVATPPASAASGAVAIQLDAPIVGLAPSTPAGQGYWEVARDGGVFSFGSAGYFGSMGGQPLDAPIVGIAGVPAGGGQGYYEVASDGGIFAFGSAAYRGSMGGQPLDAPIVGMAVTPTGGGYYEVASDGGIFAFGSATFQGSMGGRPLDAPIVGVVAASGATGYYEIGSDGGVFAFGSVPFLGSMGDQALGSPVVTAAGNPSGGYWEAGRTGAVYALGAPYDGSLVSPTPTAVPASAPNAAIAAIAESQVGNTDPYLYGPDGSDWCAYFASWVWEQAGVPIPPTGEAADVGTWALAAGGTILPPTATPQPGDAVLWVAPYTADVWPDEAGLNYPNIEHVNIVTAVLPGDEIVTVGGNENGAVRQLGPFSVADASAYAGQAIFGFVQPPS